MCSLWHTRQDPHHYVLYQLEFPDLSQHKASYPRFDWLKHPGNFAFQNAYVCFYYYMHIYSHNWQRWWGEGWSSLHDPKGGSHYSVLEGSLPPNLAVCSTVVLSIYHPRCCGLIFRTSECLCPSPPGWSLLQAPPLIWWDVRMWELLLCMLFSGLGNRKGILAALTSEWGMSGNVVMTAVRAKLSHLLPSSNWHSRKHREEASATWWCEKLFAFELSFKFCSWL